MLCQKGMEKCEDIIMHEENQYKWLFIMLNVGQEAMNTEYECEFTVKKGNLDYTEKGTPTVLLPGMFNYLGDFYILYTVTQLNETHSKKTVIYPFIFTNWMNSLFTQQYMKYEILFQIFTSWLWYLSLC